MKNIEIEMKEQFFTIPKSQLAKDISRGEQFDYYENGETQRIDKETAEKLGNYIQFMFDTKIYLQIVEVYFNNQRILNGSYIDILRSLEGVLTYEYFEINEIYNFIKYDVGLHHFGGKCPKDFTIPENNCPGSFQYIGYINKEDEPFEWLPFDLNLICPIFLDFEKVWLDYSNPKAPLLLNEKEIRNCKSPYDNLAEQEPMVFEKRHFKTEYSNDFGLGFTGIPDWVQYPNHPICPLSKRRMRLVCQLSSCLVRDLNITSKSDSIDGMNFLGDGDLFVFLEPETKIICCLMQNT